MGVNCEVDFDVGTEQFIFQFFYLDNEGYCIELKVKTNYFAEEVKEKIVSMVLRYLPEEIKTNTPYIDFLQRKLMRILTEDKRGWFDG